MEIKIRLVHGAFIFIDDFSIKRSDGDVKINLDGKPDAFLRTVATSIACGVLQSETAAIQVIELIKNGKLRQSTANSIGLNSSNGFEDIIESEVEILEVELEQEEEVEIEDETDEEEDEEVEVEDEIVPADKLPQDSTLDSEDEELKKLLVGNAKIVNRKLKSARLTEDQKEKLVTIESDTRNRTTIITAIQEA
jgi:hypothetical protein